MKNRLRNKKNGKNRKKNRNHRLQINGMQHSITNHNRVGRKHEIHFHKFTFKTWVTTAVLQFISIQTTTGCYCICCFLPLWATSVCLFENLHYCFNSFTTLYIYTHNHGQLLLLFLFLRIIFIRKHNRHNLHTHAHAHFIPISLI